MKIRGGNNNAFSFHSLVEVESIAGSGILLSTFLVIAYCVWTLDRGFDITDEAYYLLLVMHSGSVRFYISAQQWITAGLWRITGSITMFRASGLFLLLVSSAMLAVGVFSACLRFGLAEDRFKFKGVVIACSVAGAMLYATTINFSPCYNLLASAGAYVAAGAVLLATNRSKMSYKYFLYAIAGCAVGAEVLCKLSAGVAIFALLLVWAGIFERSRSDKIFGAVTMVFGTVVFAGIALLVNTTIGDATQAVQQGLQLFRMVQVEAIGPRLARYAIEFLYYILLTLGAFAAPVAAMVVYRMTRRPVFAQLGLAALVITLVFGSVNRGLPAFSVHNAAFGSYLFGGFNRYNIQIVAIFAMLIMALIVSIPVWNRNRCTLALFAGLLLLPYTVGIGTGNALFTQVIVSLAPWGALLAALAVALQSDDFGKTPASLIALCFTATIALQIITSGFRPYHLSMPLAKQDRTAVVENLGEVKVDADTYNFLAEMKSAVGVCGIAPGAPFLGLYDIPGVALALQATPMSTPWLNNPAQADFVIERLRPGELHSAVVALQVGTDGDLPALPPQLASFPSGYRYCGTATYPYRQQRIQIWQSQLQ